MSTDALSPLPGPPARVRRKTYWLPAIIFGLVLTLGIGYTFVIFSRRSEVPQKPPGAVVVFHIARSQPTVLPGPGSADPAEFEYYRHAQSALIRDRRVLATALRRPGIADLALVRAHPDPIAWLGGSLRVSFGPTPESMSVELDGEPATEAVSILNAVTVAYLEQWNHIRSGTLTRRMAQLEDLRIYYDGEIDMHQKRIDLIARALKQPDGTSMEFVFVSLHEELREAQRELREAERRAVRADDGDTRSDTELKAARANAVARAKRVGELQSEIAKHGEYRSEVEKLKRFLSEKETVNARIRAELEVARIEVRAPSRIVLAQEACPRQD